MRRYTATIKVWHLLFVVAHFHYGQSISTLLYSLISVVNWVQHCRLAAERSLRRLTRKDSDVSLSLAKPWIGTCDFRARRQEGRMQFMSVCSIMFAIKRALRKATQQRIATLSRTEVERQCEHRL